MRRFVPADLDMLNEWYAARGLPTVPLDAVPALGFITEDAAGFLYRTDAPALALIDGIVTNPETAPRRRAAAVTEIIKRLVTQAHALGVTRLVGLTHKSGMVRLCERLGWLSVGSYQLLRKEL